MVLNVYYLFGSFVSERSESVSVAFDSAVMSNVNRAVGLTSLRAAVPLLSSAVSSEFKVTRGSSTSISVSPSAIREVVG